MKVNGAEKRAAKVRAKPRHRRGNKGPGAMRLNQAKILLNYY
jgi:hypothetical protein